MSPTHRARGALRARRARRARGRVLHVVRALDSDPCVGAQGRERPPALEVPGAGSERVRFRVYRGLKCRHCRHCLPRLVGLPPPNYTYNLAHITCTPSGSLGGSTHTTWRTATTGGPRSPPQGELKAMLSSHSCRHHHAPPPTPPLWPLHHHHHPHPWYTRGQRPGSSPGGC